MFIIWAFRSLGNKLESFRVKHFCSTKGKMDFDIRTESSPEEESTSQSRQLRARKTSSSCSPEAPLAKKKKVDRNENLSVEEIYKQLSSVKAKCTALETIYEFPKNSKDPAKSLMSTVKSRRSCLLSDFYNPTKSKVRARKERAKRLKKRGVKVPTGYGVTMEQLQAVLGSISEDDESENVKNSSMKINLTVNTGMDTFTPKQVVLRPDRDRQDVSLVEGPYILPDLSYQESTPVPPPMTEEELYEKTKCIFEDPSDECVKPTRRKGRRSGCGRDLLPTSLFSHQSKQLDFTSETSSGDSNMHVTSTMVAIIEESCGDKEEPKTLPCKDPDVNPDEGKKESLSSSGKCTDFISKDCREKVPGVLAEDLSHEERVQSISCNFTSGSDVPENSTISCGSKMNSRKKGSSFTDSCLADVSRRRSKRRVSGVDKALYSSYTTHHSPVIDEAVDEETSSSNLSESLNDSLRTGFETKVDLSTRHTCTSADDASCNAKPGRTLKRKSESELMSPLAARLQTLAVRDACDDRGSTSCEVIVSSGTGQKLDVASDGAHRKLIRGSRRSTRLVTAPTIPAISQDVDHHIAILEEESKYLCQNAVMNSLTGQEGKSVTKMSAQSESSNYCAKSKLNIITSKPRKAYGKCITEKRKSMDELDKRKFLSDRGQDSEPIQDLCVGVPDECCSDNFSVTQQKVSKNNTTHSLEETSKELVGSLENCRKSNSSSSVHSSKLRSKETYAGVLKTNTGEGLPSGSKLVPKRRGRRNIFSLSADLNALSVSSQDEKVQAASVVSGALSSVSSYPVHSKSDDVVAASLKTVSEERGTEEGVSTEGSEIVCPTGPCISGNVSEDLHSALSLSGKSSIAKGESISEHSEVTPSTNNLLHVREITQVSGSSSGSQEKKQARANSGTIQRMLRKQGVKRSNNTDDSHKLLGFSSNERVHDARPDMKRESSSNEAMKIKLSSDRLGSSTRSGSKEMAVALGESSVKQTKKIKIVLNNLHKDCFFDLPSPSAARTVCLSRVSSAHTSVSKLDLHGRVYALDQPDHKPAPTNTSKFSVNSENLQQRNRDDISVDSTIKEVVGSADVPAVPQLAPPTSSASDHSSSSLLELNADSPLVSGMFNSSVGVRVGKVYTNHKLEKSEKILSRSIVNKFKLYK